MTNKIKQRKKSDKPAKDNDSDGNGSGTICNSETSLDNNVSLASDDAGYEKDLKSSSDRMEINEKNNQNNGVQALPKTKLLQESRIPLSLYEENKVPESISIKRSFAEFGGQGHKKISRLAMLASSGPSGFGKILGGPTAVFWRQKFFAKKRQIEGFQKGVNDEKLLGSACVSGGGGGGMKWAFRKDEIE
ncbi:hypothetical protein TNCV_268471 [Trichonephila clavipes]|nr:hypothetical protein TNCV_268471 [Trichonephila clavipes]